MACVSSLDGSLILYSLYAIYMIYLTQIMKFYALYTVISPLTLNTELAVQYIHRWIHVISNVKNIFRTFGENLFNFKILIIK